MIHKISGRVIKDGRNIADTPEIEDLKNRIMEMKQFAERARFTPQGYREFQAKLSALEKQLQKLQSRTGQAQNVEHLSPAAEKRLEKTLSSAKKIPFFRKGK